MKYICDTNALLNNPEVLEQYEVVIPSHVNREIEHLELTRKQDRTLQWQIRRFKRIADELDVKVFDLKDYKFTLDNELDPNYVDNILLQVAVDNGFGIITNDRLLRLKCSQYNIDVVKPEVSDFIENKGFQEMFMTKDELQKVYFNLGVNQFGLKTNEYIVIYDDVGVEGEDADLLDIFIWTGEYLESLRDKKGKLEKSPRYKFSSEHFGDFEPRDAYQIMAVDSILRNQLTSLRGRAGSGKSLIALTVAWYLVMKEQYKLVIFVNPVPTKDSQELGFYKGDKLEKLMQSAVGTMLKAKFGDESMILREIGYGKLDILPFVDLRGYDTGEKTIVWILEAQNLTSELLKLGLQRITETTKVVVDGDYSAQVDKDVYYSSNGMKRMSEVFRDTDLFGEVELQNVHRSRLADLADKM